MINKLVNEIVKYAVDKQLIDNSDRRYYLNKISGIFKLSEVIDVEVTARKIHEIVDDLFSYAVELNMYQNLSYEKEIFEARIMDEFLDKPSQINEKFQNLSKNNIKDATDWFYKYSKDSYYIKEQAISKNKHFQAVVNDINMEVTINVSKPEKDAKSILLASKMTSSYPKCPLCVENEGFIGTAALAARSNIRLIKLNLNDQDWRFQYSPYSYYNEHAILLSDTHNKMTIDEDTIKNLVAFVSEFKHYFIGSNSELPIVGGSILGHLHYQAGKYKMPIEDSKIVKTFVLDNTLVEYLNWPLSTFRIKSTNKEEIISTTNKILAAWREYASPEDLIINDTKELKNTVTPILRYKDCKFEADIILRNSHTNEEYPDGLYHVHQKYHSIKKENIGLIEAMGLAILPARLVSELETILDYANNNEADKEVIEKHQYFVSRFLETSKTKEDLEKLLVEVFYEILECCGVFKQNETGLAAADKFINFLGGKTNDN